MALEKDANPASKLLHNTSWINNRHRAANRSSILTRFLFNKENEEPSGHWESCGSSAAGTKEWWKEREGFPQTGWERHDLLGFHLYVYVVPDTTLKVNGPDFWSVYRYWPCSRNTDKVAWKIPRPWNHQKFVTKARTLETSSIKVNVTVKDLLL